MGGGGGWRDEGEVGIKEDRGRRKEGRRKVERVRLCHYGGGGGKRGGGGRTKI